MGERIVIIGRAAASLVGADWTNEIEYDKAEWEAMTEEERYQAVAEDMQDMVGLEIWYEEPDDE